MLFLGSLILASLCLHQLLFLVLSNEEFSSSLYSDNLKFEANFTLDPEFSKLEDFKVVRSKDKKYYFYGFSKDCEYDVTCK
mmetsp:Transcript_18856/g.31467  ORF Transcript_18856/g.31467 Transcript_18856/m.31467 type:complete len:81 (-) Transcript_18856:3297-3539(-)